MKVKHERVRNAASNRRIYSAISQLVIRFSLLATCHFLSGKLSFVISLICDNSWTFYEMVASWWHSSHIQKGTKENFPRQIVKWTACKLVKQKDEHKVAKFYNWELQKCSHFFTAHIRSLSDVSCKLWSLSSNLKEKTSLFFSKRKPL